MDSDIRLRFGLDGQSPLTVQPAARALKICRQRVRRIEATALNKLEKVLPQSNL